MSRYLNAREAAEKLGITLPTLYAYVSRGLIRSEASADRTRQRRYYAEDVEKLLQRKEASRHPEKAAETALHWGMPVMESALTLILDNHLYYRGYDAVILAEDSTIEQTAALLWLGSQDQADVLFGDAGAVSAGKCLTALDSLLSSSPYMTEIQTLQTALALAASDDLAAYDLRPEAVAQTGARILRLMALTVTRQESNTLPIADLLHQAWCPDQPQAERLLNAALVLSADHELNVSSFTARVVASSAANPYAVVIAALSAFQGVRHGGGVEQVGAFLREVGTPDQARMVILERLRRGEALPGFGHQVYDGADPRAVKLLSMIEAQNTPAAELANRVIVEASNLAGKHPNIDFALGILSLALGLPARRAMVIFALGRAVGWIGHAIEQYENGQLIRPRARYIGALPSDG